MARYVSHYCSAMPLGADAGRRQMAIELAAKLGFSEQALAQMTTEQYERIFSSRK